MGIAWWARASACLVRIRGQGQGELYTQSVRTARQTCEQESGYYDAAAQVCEIGASNGQATYRARPRAVAPRQAMFLGVERRLRTTFKTKTASVPSTPEVFV